METRRRPRRCGLASLAITALLTFAPFCLHAQGATLTADQRSTLMMLMASFGHDVALSPDVTAALGVSKSGETLTLRQISVNGHPNLHTYVPLPDGGLMLSVNDNNGVWVCRLDADLRLIAGVSKLSGHPPIVVPMADAERDIEAELA